MHGNNVKKDSKNGQLDCRIYGSPAAEKKTPDIRNETVMFVQSIHCIHIYLYRHNMYYFTWINNKSLFRLYRAIADPSLQRRRTAAGELCSMYPTRELAIFVIFFYIVPIRTYSFLILLSLQQAHNFAIFLYCKNPRVKKSNIVVFMGL